MRVQTETPTGARQATEMRKGGGIGHEDSGD